MFVAGTSPSHPLSDYAGSYAHPGYGTLTMAVAGDALEVTFNGITAPLEHRHYDVWHGADTDSDPTFEDVPFLFRGNFDGEIAGVVAPFEPTAAPIVFDKQADPRMSDPAFLERFVGAYVEEVSEQRAEVVLSGSVLTLELPNQPLYTLVPLPSRRFGIEGLQGFTVGFEDGEDGEVAKIVFYQPNGVFESKRVEE